MKDTRRNDYFLQYLTVAPSGSGRHTGETPADGSTGRIAAPPHEVA